MTWHHSHPPAARLMNGSGPLFPGTGTDRTARILPEPTTGGGCPECGGTLIWNGQTWQEHSPRLHEMRRRILYGILATQLQQEHRMREAARHAGRRGAVLVWWRVRAHLGLGYYRCEIPGELWDSGDRAWILDMTGRSLRDGIEAFQGLRPHPMQTRCRVYDER